MCQVGNRLGFGNNKTYSPDLYQAEHCGQDRGQTGSVVLKWQIV